MENGGARKLRLSFYLLMIGVVLLISGTTLILGASSGTQAAIPDISQAQWQIMGPFPNPPGEDPWVVCQGFDLDYLTDIGGETKARFKKGMKIWGQVVPKAAQDGAINFLSLYPNNVNTVAYAYLEVTSSQAQKVALKLGSDDGVKVWLNGALIWVNHSHRMVIPDQDAVAVNLRRGVNRLLVKVEQASFDWGFSCRMRALADEAYDWAKVKKPALQTILPHTLITEKSQAWCIVNTVPAFVIPEPVILLIYDGEGKELASRKGTIGEPIALQLPAKYEGIINVCAVSAGKEPKLKSPYALALVGDRRKITETAVAEARAISKGYVFDSKKEDLGATLTFLADQLEGKMYQSLVTPERNLRAIQSINNLKKVLQQGSWQAGALRGIRQWAYRSEIDDSCQPYTVYLPETYDPQKQYRLLVALHGQTTDDYWMVRILYDYYQPEDFIIVGAFGRGDMGYYSFGEKDVLDVLERVQQIYNIDPDGVYLMGESMGGMATWRMGQFYADRFAAIAPFCGWTGTDYLGNLRNLPALIVHGNADPMVPYSMDSAAAGRLKELGYDFRYAELPGAGHNAWEVWAETQGGEAIFKFFRKYRRNPWPVEVNARIKYLRYGRQYWVWIKELAPPLSLGTVHAIVKGSREIQVETNGVASLTLDLRHPKLQQTGEIKINIDNQTLMTSAAQKKARFDFEPDKGWQAGFENEPTPKELAASSKPAPHLGGGVS
ncbi:MAG TPA: hypothetical protein VHY08_04160 [Bacillota bacterium]|nr:hypothetical protein [Bacillota bacterium]